MQKKIFLILTLLTLLTVNMHTAALQPEVISKIVDFGMKKVSDRVVDVIIVHSVYNASGGEQYNVDLIVKQFAKYKVCAHYLIGREGEIIQLVQEQNIAFHAGASKLPDGSTGINSRSIGIEIVTSLTDAPAEAQIAATISLVKDIQSRHPIKYLLRHSDIAPERKTDPWNMDWKTFLHLTATTK